MIDPIALGIPFFFLLIAIEYAWAKRRNVVVYRFGDSLTNLSCGITSQVALLFWGAVQLAIYAKVYERFHLVTWSRAWVPWLIAFVGVDFFYYWWHRLSHEVNVLWAAHVVHHQSEDYNLAVALRQAVLTSWTVLPFYLPLALLGVPVLPYAVMVALSTLYQFWIHTQLVGKVRGPLDYILNLPSHHRVHHAINEEYLDKNYGAVLIVWDRLFGTYTEEVATPVYGITKPIGSFDPMWAQIHYWLELGAMTRAATGPFDKARVWLASPAWKPAGYSVKTPAIDGRTKYAEVKLSRGLTWYVAIQYVIVIAAAFALIMWHARLPMRVIAASSLAIVGALISIGGLLQGRAWARAAEAGRLFVAVGAIALFATSTRHEKKPIALTHLEGESAVLPAPTAAAEGALDSSTASVTIAGAPRTYLALTPHAPEAGKKYPVVFVLHGDGGDADEFHHFFPFEKTTRGEAVLVYPDGIGRTWDLESTTDNREIAFFTAIVNTLEARYPIDRTRIFAAGYSSGGFLANVVACQKSGFFRAISSSAGGAPYHQAEAFPNGFTRCPGEAPTAAIALHGESDFGVSLESGRFSAEYWAYVNGCNGEQMETTHYAECQAYRGCPAGKPVVWCQVPRLNHWVWDRAAEASWTFFQRVSE